MTCNPNVKDDSERGLAVILKGQRDTGLWDDSYRTVEGEDSIDASIWQVLTVKSGLMADLKTAGLRESLSKASDAMERVLAAKPDAGTTVGALLCLQMGGRSMKTVCREAFAGLATMTADWNAPSFRDPILRWHLASQVFYWKGGARWAQWSQSFVPMLCEHQVVEQGEHGQEFGYWDSPGDGERCGRVYTTAMSLSLLSIINTISSLPTFSHETKVELVTTNDDIVVEIDLPLL
jgi:hypothetical protein